MNTPDKVDEVKKRGRPSKQDKSTPLGDFIAEEAQKSRERRVKNKVIESWYELCGPKLSLAKRKESGVVYRTFVGSVDDKKTGAQVSEFVKRLQKENRLRIKV